ncbi:MAG TPA: hypothetical protein VJL07_03615 [Dehalococcoidia bacterium]|nr:hypothetical protein [Dehalococcoidia bacterium]
MSGATSARPANPDQRAESARIIAELKRVVATGETHWFLALMQAVREWPLAEERVGDRVYRYLIAGEAFDWLLLAERLCDEIEGLVPDEEREALLFHGRLPEEVDENDVERLLGAKHRAHLNFVYGVRVEEALQLAVAAEVHKERFASRVWENGQGDDEVFHRLYGGTRADLFAEFRLSQQPQPLTSRRKTPLTARAETPIEHAADNGRAAEDNGHADGDHISLSELTEFTYWLFRRRVNGSEPARVASDTRKGVAMLQRLESRRAAAPTS